MAENNATVEYRDIKDRPGYRVGTDGSIWSRRSVNGRGPLKEEWRRLNPAADSKGRLFVTLCTHPLTAQIRYVHHLVLEAFAGPCPEGMEACHFPDADPTNNTLANLRWDTRQANARDSVAQGVQVHGERHTSAKLTDEKVRALRAEYAAGGATKAALARKYGIAAVNVTRAILRRTWKHVV